MGSSVQFEELALGESRIDGQHELVLRAMAALQAAVEFRSPRAETERLLDTFAEVVRWHFASEAELMRSARYPEAPEHMAEHRRLLDQLGEVRAEFAAGKIQPGGAFALFAQVWTTQHILGPDRRFTEFLKGEGAPRG